MGVGSSIGLLKPFSIFAVLILISKAHANAEILKAASPDSLILMGALSKHVGYVRDL